MGEVVLVVVAKNAPTSVPLGIWEVATADTGSGDSPVSSLGWHLSAQLDIVVRSGFFCLDIESPSFPGLLALAYSSAYYLPGASSLG